jgi:hypothetical protein
MKIRQDIENAEMVWTDEGCQIPVQYQDFMEDFRKLKADTLPPHKPTHISKMYFRHWKPPGVSGRMWSVNLDASISGEYQTLGGHSCWPSE